MLKISDLKITARQIAELLEQNGIKVEVLSENPSLIYYEDKKGKSHFVQSSLLDLTPATAFAIAENKNLTYKVAAKFDISVPKTTLINPEMVEKEKIEALVVEYGRITIKPIDAAHGLGVSTNIADIDLAMQSLELAAKYSSNILVQEHVEGEDYRVLVINGEVVSSTHRIAARVTGDGQQTLEQLITLVNRSPERQSDSQGSVYPIKTESAQSYLADRYRTEVPEKGKVVRVIGPCNRSLGGSVKDGMPDLTDEMKNDAKKLTKVLSMPICAIDFIKHDETGKHVLIEINATPSLDEHNSPIYGTHADVINMLKPLLGI